VRKFTPDDEVNCYSRGGNRTENLAKVCHYKFPFANARFQRYSVEVVFIQLLWFDFQVDFARFLAIERV